jgi:hypothetical protein
LSSDRVWIEHGGEALDNGFFEIPTLVKYRNMSEIPTRKRAQLAFFDFKRDFFENKLALVCRAFDRQRTCIFSIMLTLFAAGRFPTVIIGIHA